MKQNNVILSNLQYKFGYKKIKLPDYFHELSGWKIDKGQAWDILFSLRNEGKIVYIKYRSIKIKR